MRMKFLFITRKKLTQTQMNAIRRLITKATATITIMNVPNGVAKLMALSQTAGFSVGRDVLLVLVRIETVLVGVSASVRLGCTLVSLTAAAKINVF